MSKQTAVRLPDELFDRLNALAARTGRTTTFYIREAIEEHLEELEDLYMAEDVLTRRQAGDDKTLTLDELSRDLGLDN
ncbi:RHH-type rel operon transcriptional repressor/antitoxin RelB [Devosia sp. UYZn731]|uniref:type II toxin-antitoxin system RelB family antitoxin n=1 Tax=Devosia sp. UYZn731 TaxID=3156345 RepID=UPI0033933687